MAEAITLYDHIAANNRKTFLLVALFPLSLFVLVTIACVFAVSLNADRNFTLEGIHYVLSVFPNVKNYIHEGNINLWSGIGYALTCSAPITIIALVWSFVSFMLGDKMMLGCCGAFEVSKNDNPKIYNMVENVAISAGLPTPKLYIINDSSLNAFATGRCPKTASVTLTTGIIEKLEPLELEAVIAHEMAHIGNRDIRLNMLIITGLSVFGFAADIIRRSIFRSSRRGSDKKQSQIVVLLFFVMIALLLFNMVVAPLIQLAISRKREYAADATGALIVRNPLAMASALEKISQDARVENLDSQPRMAIACIANPSLSAALKVKELFSTHPSIESRIYRLRQSAGRF